MESYNFWQDFFDTYQSLSDWMKTLWLIVPPTFALGALWLGLDYRLKSRSPKATGDGMLAYTVFADETGIWRIHAHRGAVTVTDEGPEATVLPLPGAHPHTLPKPPASDV
ncbi:hypothetical protein AB1P65_22955 [Roseibium alexandrii]